MEGTSTPHPPPLGTSYHKIGKSNALLRNYRRTARGTVQTGGYAEIATCFLARDFLRLRLAGTLRPLIRPVSRYRFSSHVSATIPRIASAVMVSPRRNAAHASPARLGMTKEPMTTATATRSTRKGWVKTCPRRMARESGDGERNAEIETQPEGPMPKDVHCSRR